MTRRMVKIDQPERWEGPKRVTDRLGSRPNYRLRTGKQRPGRAVTLRRNPQDFASRPVWSPVWAQIGVIHGGRRGLCAPSLSANQWERGFSPGCQPDGSPAQQVTNIAVATLRKFAETYRRTSGSGRFRVPLVAAGQPTREAAQAPTPSAKTAKTIHPSAGLGCGH